MCDSVTDCSEGEDEDLCRASTLSCPNLLYCKEDGICIHQHQYCDGILHCQLSRDDEFLCENEQCPSGCTCHGQTVFCPSDGMSDAKVMTVNEAVRGLIIHGCLSCVRHMEMFPNTVLLKIYEVLLPSVFLCNMIGSMEYLHYLLIANINVTVIESNVFSGLKFLKSIHTYNITVITIAESGLSGMASLPLLNLSVTSLRHVKKCAFCFMVSLVSLDISYNLIAYINEDALNTSSIEGLTINLTGNPIAYVEGYIQGQIHTLVVGDNGGVCCFTNPVMKCDSNATKVDKACGTLFPHFRYVAVWMLLVLWIIGGNLGAIVLNSENKATQFYIIQTMAFSDILYGLHMLSILSLHYIYSTQFVFRSKLPLNLLFCKIASVLLHVSLITSRTSVLLITINYLLVTKYALKFIRLTKKHILILLIIVWSVSITTYILLANEVDSVDSSPLCTSFGIQTHGIVPTMASVLLVVYLYSTTIVIACIYYGIIQYTNECARRAGRRNTLLGKLLSKACVTVIVCTITTSAVMVLQVGQAYGFLVGRRSELWVLGLASLDASLNPFIYTLYIRLKKKNEHVGGRAIRKSPQTKSEIE